MAAASLRHPRAKRGSRSAGAASSTLDARLRGHDGAVGGCKVLRAYHKLPAVYRNRRKDVCRLRDDVLDHC